MSQYPQIRLLVRHNLKKKKNENKDVKNKRKKKAHRRIQPQGGAHIDAERHDAGYTHTYTYTQGHWLCPSLNTVNRTYISY